MHEEIISLTLEVLRGCSRLWFIWITILWFICLQYWWIESCAQSHFVYNLQAVAFILIGVAAYAKAVAVIATVSVMGGIIACGVFLLLVAIIGLIGAVKHHQVLLFFVSFNQLLVVPMKMKLTKHFLFQVGVYDICLLK